MDASFQNLLPQVGKCAGLVLGSALVMGFIMRKGSAAGARWVRAACVLALLQGWMLLPFPVTLAWLAPAPQESSGSIEAVSTAAQTQGATAQQRQDSPWRTTQIIGVLWISGMAAVLLLTAANHRRTTRSFLGARPATPALQQEWQRVAGGRGGAVRVLTGPTHSPVLCRLHGRWALVLPVDFSSALDADERRTVLRHEFAHFERGDCVKSLLVTLLVLPQWFNPAAWRVARWFREAAEWSCDDYAAGNSDERLCLAKIIQRLSAQTRTPLPCGMMGIAGHPALARVRRLLAPRGRISSVLMVCMMALLLASLTVSATQICLVPADILFENAASGVITGTLQERHSGGFTLVDAAGRTWKFTGRHDWLATYHEGETYSVRWERGPGGLLAQRVSGDGSVSGTIVSVREDSLEIRPHDGGPIQHIRAHWDAPSPGHPYGGSNRDDVRLIGTMKEGDAVHVEWHANEWKRLTRLERMPLP